MQLSLVKAIRKLSGIWLSFSLFLLLLVLLQTIFGKYGNHPASAWLWLMINILPGNLLLIFGYLRHKKIGTILLPKYETVLYQIVYYVSLAYLLGVTATLLLQPFGDETKTEAEKLHAADTGLYIFQGFLMLLSILFIYRVEHLFRSQQLAPVAIEDELSVFISYNHTDRAIAEQLKKQLEKEDVTVLLDTDAMSAGQDIKTFIEDCVRKSRVTLSIVSEKSLLSGWVGMEAIHTFYFEKFSAKKKFIACFIDDAFMNQNFTSEAVRIFDSQLQEINLLIEQHNRLGIDTRDLNDNKTRLLAIRNNMDAIIQRLRNSLCVDIKGNNLSKNFSLIVKSIKEEIG